MEYVCSLFDLEVFSTRKLSRHSRNELVDWHSFDVTGDRDISICCADNDLLC